ncbi:metal ABC transporter solute-binding protein, Zn/Mn family [Paenibacillus aquistagni]|uniref:Manganese/zinc/iron transport system substrate-binding protein n=1 Tax=Paenibacillus aquistagni TaxID=1852522 RepID=A0A1X7IX78_9BACL|nr:zinc ABC transporter substrate-binding protein [Paenibacillus aquistagni]SMG19511.1 manganese/zinc/iron transport system substrate-binding protein [Paenibacillus aquistagni]
MKKKVVRKKMMVVGVLALALSVVISACGAKEQEGASSKPEKDKLTVVTTIAQIAEPLSVIGGDRIHVESLMGPGIDPHTYNASQGDIQKLESGDMIFYSGLHLEANMVKVFDEISKTRTVVAISESIAPEKLLKDEEGTTDPHVWFDIDLWKEAINNATEALKKERTQDADFFEANKVKYFEELDKLKLEAQAKLSEIPKDKRVLVTAHDAFGYFGRMLDIEVVGLQGLSTEDEIGLSDIEDTIQTLVKYEVPAVFVESSVNPASINAVIEGAKKQGLDVKLGGELFSDAMGVAGTEEGTYLGMYRHNVETIYHALNAK